MDLESGWAWVSGLVSAPVMDWATSRRNRHRRRTRTAWPPIAGSKSCALRRILAAGAGLRNRRAFTSLRGAGFEDRVGQQEPDGLGAWLVDGLVRERSQHLVATLACTGFEFGMREDVEIVALDPAHHALAALDRVHPQLALRALRELLLELLEARVLLVLVRPQLAELADVALHGARAERRDADVRRRELAGQAFREAHEHRLRRDVDGAVRDRNHRGHARGVDDVATLAVSADARQHGEDAVHHAADHHRQAPVPVVILRLVDGA